MKLRLSRVRFRANALTIDEAKAFAQFHAELSGPAIVSPEGFGGGRQYGRPCIVFFYSEDQHKNLSARFDRSRAKSAVAV